MDPWFENDCGYFLFLFSHLFRPKIELYVTIKEMKFISERRCLMLTHQDSVLVLFLFHSSNQEKSHEIYL